MSRPSLLDSLHLALAQAFDALFEAEHIKKLSEGPLAQLNQTLARCMSVNRSLLCPTQISTHCK